MKQTICLNMIVKNEEHVIGELLESVYKYIDYYVINDTGSTDKTKEIIKNFFDSKNIKGEIIDHEFRACTCHDKSYKRFKWFHYGWNRTYALEKCYGKSDYIFIMDADDMISGEMNISNLTAVQYELPLFNGNLFYRPLIIKNDRKYGWEWHGGLHEYLAPKISVVKERLESNFYIMARTAGDRNKTENKYANDAKVFEELLIEEPNNSRYLFYCARSHMDAKQNEQAIEYFEKRVKAGGWYEEVYYSLYQIGCCKNRLGYDEKEIVDAFLKANTYHPGRVEPLYEIIVYYSYKGKFKEALSYRKKALAIKYPINDVLFISKNVYDFALKDHLAYCGYRIEDFKTAYELWSQLANNNCLNNVIRKDQYALAAYFCDDYKLANKLWLEVTFDKPEYDTERISNNIKWCHIKLNSDEVQLKEYLKSHQKDILCFYVGDEENLNKKNDEYQQMIVDIAKVLSEHYTVLIFGQYQKFFIDDKILFCSSHSFDKFQNDVKISIMIITQNINYFIDYPITAKKTYLWLNSENFILKLNNIEVDGKALIKNIENKIDGVITFCNWHKKKFIDDYRFDESKVTVIQYANDDIFESTEKINNRFIYISHSDALLEKTIYYFKKLLIDNKNIELYVYEDREDIPETLLKEIDGCENIIIKEYHEEINKEFLEADVYLYPSKEPEILNFNMLKALKSNCLCVTSNVGCLSDIIKDSGILIKSEPYSELYDNDLLTKMNFLLDELSVSTKKLYQEKGFKWISSCNLKSIGEKWLELLSTK